MAPSHQLLTAFLLLVVPMPALAQSQTGQIEPPISSATDWQDGEFRWKTGEPFLVMKPENFPDGGEHPWLSVKDPSIVRFKDRWHLFCSVRRNKSGNGRIRIGYTSFKNFSDAKDAKWRLLDLTPGYHGAPQVFFFRPHQKWYLVYQAEDSSRSLKYGPCFSTNDDLDDPSGWTLPEPLYSVPEGKKAGLDFWVICDSTHAHLFFTSLNGRMWRASTSLKNFPSRQWSEPAVVLRDDIFEASHTYKLRGRDQFLTIIEAQAGRRGRYYKAYVADSLSGDWNPLAATANRPFAAPSNVTQSPPWTGSISHGELIRAGHDELLEVDPQQLRFVFQGASEADYGSSGNYGLIPWKLGILDMADGSETNSEKPAN